MGPDENLARSFQWTWDRPLKLFRVGEEFVASYPSQEKNNIFFLISKDREAKHRVCLDYKTGRAYLFRPSRSGNKGFYNRPLVESELKRSMDLYKEELKEFEEIWYFKGLFVPDKSQAKEKIQNILGIGNTDNKGLHPENRK
eukprot:GHVP01070473.1.p1 GENE.GHVP01070473.1~~GHVP01070473.1.p1  ORF type:complete len:142 (-),score=25.97 GHVP01070473.1:18-443(-)